MPFSFFIPISYGIFRTFAIISEKMGTGHPVPRNSTYSRCAFRAFLN